MISAINMQCYCSASLLGDGDGYRILGVFRCLGLALRLMLRRTGKTESESHESGGVRQTSLYIVLIVLAKLGER